MRSALLVASLLVCLVALACSDVASEERRGSASAEASAARTAAQATPEAPRPEAKPPAATPPRRRRERPLPAWTGSTLSGERKSLSSLLGRRVVLFFFNPAVPTAGVVADALAHLAPLSHDHNFEIVGVALDGEPDALRGFLDAHGLEVTTLVDDQASLAGRIGLRSPVGVIVADAEGYMVRATDQFPDQAPHPVTAVEDMLRDWLRLPPTGGVEIAMFGERPAAPDFTTERLDGGTFELASLRGRPAVLVFFLHTCPHCHHALGFFKEALAALPEDRRPALVGISVLNRTIAVRQRLEEEGLDYFPVLLDPEGTVQQRYGATQGVPVIFFLDAEGRVVARTEGWLEDRDPALARMRLAKIAGERVPMLLHKTGYSGNDVCAVCHEKEAASWELTTHATAFDTLVRHGADHDAECVGCHVVGYGESGGWSFEQHVGRPLEGVGCETCHGRGGPHLSPGFVQNHDYRAVCQDCHNPEHSLGFVYEEFLPKVSHAANRELAGLPLAEKRRILAERRQPRDVLASDAPFVGSKVCGSCHPAEHESWAAHPHGRALASLEAKGQSDDPACLACHTTGYGEPGGFPPGGSPADHADLAAVGCESCHGPGGDHVAAGAPKAGTIVSLGDKCDSCVILQICGGCHDDANDPGFEYEVQEKIEAQRHGTIEPGRRQPAQEAGEAEEAEAAIPPATAAALLEPALRPAPERPPGERG